MRIPLRGTRSATAMVGALCLATMGLVATPATAAPPPTPAPAVPNLTWQPCDDGFSCATATVPLDYAHHTGATITIALIKHPATDPAHRIGSVFFNPGGPGGGSAIATSRQVYSLFPPAMRARYDMVSFDPRGTGQSTVLQCFDTNEQEQRLIGADEDTFPTNPAEQRSFEHDFAAFDAACAAHAGPLLAHDSTADVARDMDLLRQAVGDRTLNYFGNSYGTYLGATYANLFPGKVGAFVLDANADPVAWATGTHGSANVLSTLLRQGSDRGSAATLDAFLTLCGQATPSSCAFSAGTPTATHTKLDTLMTRMAGHPVTIDGQTFTQPATVDTLVGMLGQAVPIPHHASTGWREAAKLLQSLWEQTGAAAPGTVPPMATVPPEDGPYQGLESTLGVTCSDSPNPRDPRSYEAQSDFAAARSGVVGPDWVWGVEACAQWPVLATDRYTGPWKKPTAHPILVVGTTFDASTPYQGSVAMVHELANARLLTVNGYGHGTITNPSACATRIEDAYFATGALPPPGTVCQQDAAPFAS